MKKPVKVTLEDRVLGLVVKVDTLEKRVEFLDGWRKDHNEWLSSLHEDRRARLNEPKPTPNLDWRAELEKFIPLAKVLNENPREYYCVIGDQAKSGYSNIGRTWKGTRAQAEDHAASILRNHPGCPELLVVQVVSKVGRKEPDIQVVRV